MLPIGPKRFRNKHCSAMPYRSCIHEMHLIFALRPFSNSLRWTRGGVLLESRTSGLKASILSLHTSAYVFSALNLLTKEYLRYRAFIDNPSITKPGGSAG